MHMMLLVAQLVARKLTPAPSCEMCVLIAANR
jgi:hypothetical protein